MQQKQKKANETGKGSTKAKWRMKSVSQEHPALSVLPDIYDQGSFIFV